MTQRWGHHSAEGNKSSSITPMKSSTLRYLCRAPIWASVFWFVFWFEICGSFTCSNTERARKRGMESHMMCTSANTQLESLLYLRDERSATWAFPCCDLAPFGESVMYTCTHFPQQYTRSTSYSPSHSFSVQPAEHKSLHLSIVVGI